MKPCSINPLPRELERISTGNCLCCRVHSIRLSTNNLFMPSASQKPLVKQNTIGNSLFPSLNLFSHMQIFCFVQKQSTTSNDGPHDSDLSLSQWQQWLNQRVLVDLLVQSYMDLHGLFMDLHELVWTCGI